MARPQLLSIRSIMIAMLGLFCAGASALAAFDSVHERRAAVAVSGGPMTPGFALSHRAMALMAAHADEGGEGLPIVPLTIGEEARLLSLEALRREPLDAAAMRNLALLAAQTDAADGPAAQQWLALAERVTRRDRQTNVLLAQQAALAGDLPATMARIDQALRTSPSARRDMLPLLYQALETQGATAILATMLAENVNWESDFWAQAASHKPALEPLAMLRINRAEAGFAGTAHNDRRLLDALVDARLFRAAEEVSDVILAADSARTGAVRNGEFARAPQFGAFGWELRFDDAMTTEILAGTGMLSIRTYSAGGGLAARQLVALPQPRYRLELRAQEWEARDSESFAIRLTCAEQVHAPRVFDDLQANSRIDFAKTAPSCVYHWLDLVVGQQVDRRENVFVIDSIALTPLPGEGV